MSVCEITKPHAHTPTGEPVEGGLCDARLGNTDRGNEEHPGYFGHIEVSPLDMFGFKKWRIPKYPLCRVYS